ncbi:MAG: tetratricopeptide repeat protein [Labilithrix sp.]|nr:tetratricopeptide repeat protein [Labilithrix sp.]
MKRGVSRPLRLLVASTMAALVAVAVAPDAEASASSALQLVQSARAHEKAQQEDLALRRYMEALSLDPTCEEAYLGLGNLRARRGDLRESERVYSVALEHLPALRAARVARAHVRRALGARTEAIDDLLTGAESDVAALRVLATWHGEDGQIPAQLSVWRRIAAQAAASEDAALLREARTMVRALVILVGTADPAASPPDAHDRAARDGGLRRTASVVAKRGGA